MSPSSSRLATMIDRIADSHGPVNIQDVSGDKTSSLTVLQMLESFGVVEAVNDDSYRHTSESAKHFLQSLAEYVRSGKPLLSGWARAIPAAGANQLGFPNGPAVTLAMETLRSKWADAAPIRFSEVAQIIIKARLGWGVGYRYLVRWDPKASEYQLVGGHKRPEDKSIEETMRRELEEEVPGIFNSSINDRLSHYAESTVVQVSRTHGALTEYTMHFFTAIFASRAPSISQSERWVTVSDMVRGKLRSGEVINQSGLKAALNDMQGSLEELPPSFAAALRPPLRLIARQIGAYAGGGIALIASIATLVQFVAWLA